VFSFTYGASLRSTVCCGTCHAAASLQRPFLLNIVAASPRRHQGEPRPPPLFSPPRDDPFSSTFQHHTSACHALQSWRDQPPHRARTIPRRSRFFDVSPGKARPCSPSGSARDTLALDLRLTYRPRGRITACGERGHHRPAPGPPQVGEWGSELFIALSSPHRGSVAAQNRFAVGEESPRVVSMRPPAARDLRCPARAAAASVLPKGGPPFASVAHFTSSCRLPLTAARRSAARMNRRSYQ